MGEKRNVTIVTALYNINKHQKKKQKRPFSDYKEWILQVMNLNANIVIFGEDDLKQIISEYLDKPNITFIELPFEDLYYYQYLNDMKRIMAKDSYHRKAENPNRNSLFNPYFDIVIYSKFHFLQEAISRNVYKSDYFYWVDAGALREEKQKVLDAVKKIPFNELTYFHTPKSKIVIECRPSVYYFKVTKHFYYQDVPVSIATTFGGGKDAVLQLCKNVKEVFHDMLSKDVIVEEQIAMSKIILLNKKNYVLKINYAAEAKFFRLFENATGHGMKPNFSQKFHEYIHSLPKSLRSLIYLVLFVKQRTRDKLLDILRKKFSFFYKSLLQLRSIFS